MNKQILRITLVGVFLLAAAGCAMENSAMAPTLTATTQPNNTPAPSQTAPLVPSTTTHTLTPTMNISECIQLEEVEQIEIEGVLALELVRDGTFVLVRTDGEHLNILSNTLSSSVTSPDHTEIAFISWFSEELVIADSNGSILRKYQIPREWIGLHSWNLDNQLFILKDMDLESKFELSGLIIFDEETGGYEEIAPDFPNIKPWVESSRWYGNLIFLPDPLLNYVLYELSGGGVSLWDIDSQMETMRIFNDSLSTSGPVWGQDGEWFITSAPVKFVENGVWYTNVVDEMPYVMGGNDLILVTTKGEIQRLTYFAAQFNASQDSWSLSPDETRLAFWVDIDIESSGYHYQLAVLDLPTEILSVFCFYAGDIRDPLVPIWSPDSGALMVTRYDPTAHLDADVFLIDLQSNELYKFPEHAFGKSWLSSED
jgi:hypothetical protein